MSDTDHLFQYLVQTIEARFPAYLTHPFEVGELYQTILPYRHHRRELGFDTNQDYEMALTELLSGAGDYLVVDERMRDRLQKELASTNPDPGAFREFASAHVSLDGTAVARIRGAAPEQPQSTRRSAPAEGRESTSGTSAPTPRPPENAERQSMNTARRPSARASDVQPSTTCRYCCGLLPAGRPVTFCPHCGQNLTVVNCAACGAELEVGWKFCPTCGRPAAADATV
jgi:hypothetical protein